MSSTVIASERLGCIMEPLGSIVRMVEHVREVAPELEPELAAINQRLLETIEHLQAAVAVLGVRADLL